MKPPPPQPRPQKKKKKNEKEANRQNDEIPSDPRNGIFKRSVINAAEDIVLLLQSMETYFSPGRTRSFYLIDVRATICTHVRALARPDRRIGT